MADKQNNLDFSPVPAPAIDALISVEQQRAIEETQAAMIIAKRFPRDIDDCILRIKKACRRKSLATVATYAYPRGQTQISGPSIRLLEVIGQNWNNLTFGIAELSQDSGVSDVQAFAHDLETNVRMSKTFKVAHQRKARGSIQTLTDPRDIYEMVANQGARRMRACLMGVIPRDVIEEALAQCEKTLQSDEKPLEDRIRAMLDKFDAMGVSKPMIEGYVKHAAKLITASELAHLISVYNALRDGQATRDAFFAIPRSDSGTISDLNGAIDDAETGSDPAAGDEPPPPPDEKPQGKIICAGCGRDISRDKIIYGHIDTKTPGEYCADCNIKQLGELNAAVKSKPVDKAKAKKRGGFVGMPAWKKKGRNFFHKWVKANQDEIAKMQPDEVEEIRAKWARFYPGKAFPGETDARPSETKKVPKKANHMAGERFAVWQEITAVYDRKQIEKAQRELGFAVSGVTPPATLDGCNVLLDHLNENFKR
jgi:hypothetical protein